ncbi:MAG TPA: YciI family protein [Mucilaginibacter sp.]
MPGNVVTDGPYAEIKEILMGVSVLKVATIDEAVEIAKGCPILKFGGNVEVRPVIMAN